MAARAVVAERRGEHAHGVHELVDRNALQHLDVLEVVLRHQRPLRSRCLPGGGDCAEHAHVHDDQRAEPRAPPSEPHWRFPFVVHEEFKSTTLEEAEGTEPRVHRRRRATEDARCSIARGLPCRQRKRRQRRPSAGTWIEQGRDDKPDRNHQPVCRHALALSMPQRSAVAGVPCNSPWLRVSCEPVPPQPPVSTHLQ